MSVPSVFDTHCHLQKKYYDDVDAVVARARAAGVCGMVTIGSAGSVAIAEEAIALAESHADVWATVGFHPHEAAAVGRSELEAIESLASHERVVAVGEIGLDYYYERSPRDRQREAFASFVDIARRVGKPVVIHNRESDRDCMDMFHTERIGDVGGVVHCFTSSWELARTALDNGMFLGFTGIVTFKRSEEVRDVLRRTPHDRVVIETDSPYLAPVPFRGKQNEPAWVAHVVPFVADALGLSVAAAAELTTANARRLYRLG